MRLLIPHLSLFARFKPAPVNHTNGGKHNRFRLNWAKQDWCGNTLRVYLGVSSETDSYTQYDHVVLVCVISLVKTTIPYHLYW